jgi:hypothetical protein
MAAIAQTPDIHTEAGARWLAPFLVALLATILIALAMVVYPYVSA